MNDLKSYPEVQKWLNGRKFGTQQIYISALSAYVEYTKLDPTSLIDEAEEDREKKVRDRGLPEQRIKSFREWLLTKYQQKTHGPRLADKKRLEKIGVSENLANVYCAAVKGFYHDNGFKVEVTLEKASSKKENFKLIIRAPEMAKLLNTATSIRDKAIIKLMYESSQGVSEVCALDYGDIQRFTEDGMEVWQFHIVRKKTKTEYFTEIGEECIELLKLYLEERKRNGEELKEDSPLFVKEGAHKFTWQRITPNLIENTFKSLAIKSGLVSEEKMAKADLNPARPHSLRAAGMDVLKLDGCPELAVEFRSGHELDTTQQAYWLARPDELRKLFRQHYNALRVQTGTPQIVEEKVKQLERMIAEKEITANALLENGKIKWEMIQHLEEELGFIKRKLAFLDKYISLSDVVDSEDKAKRVLEFFETLRTQKLAENRVEEQKAEADAKAEISEKLKFKVKTE